MNLPPVLTIAHLFTVVILAAIGAWFGKEGGWEPIIAFLGGLVPYCGTGWALLQKIAQLPEPIPPDFHQDDFATVAAETIENLPLFGEPPKPFDIVTPSGRSRDRQISASVLAFLQKLGFLTIDNNNLVAPVSERALCFLRNMAITLQDDNQFLGDWTSVGTGNPENDKLRRIMSEAEEYRFRKNGDSAPCTREIRSSIILLKGSFEGTPRYLLQWSNAWGDGYFWFIGGIMEPKDTSIENCAYRELLEELGLERPMIQSLTKLGVVKDKRVSSRVGALTSYDYTVFTATLDSKFQRVKAIHKLEFTDAASVSWTTHERRSKWHTWDEIMASPELNRDAGRIVKAVTKSGIDRIPPSTPIELHT